MSIRRRGSFLVAFMSGVLRRYPINLVAFNPSTVATVSRSTYSSYSTLDPVSTWLGGSPSSGGQTVSVCNQLPRSAQAGRPSVGKCVTSTSLGWEGNRRSGVTLAMRHTHR